MRYNPIEPPDPDVWRNLDEQERLILIEDFHRRAGDEARSPQLHSVVHATVEDQVAASEVIVCDTLARLQSEGLDRHEAIHAIGSIMTKHLYAVPKSKAEPVNLHDAYLAEVQTLTADRWRAEAAESLDDQDRNDPLGDGTDPRPLSAAELAQLRAFLARIGSDDALTLEGLDGFFCALVAGPELVLPSEYLPVVWGGSAPEDGVFADAEEANTILQLMMRHWNAIIGELETHAVYEMLLGEPDERGLVGRAWARGFMRGVAMRRASWRELFRDQNEGQLLTIPLVAGEIDPDFPPEPLPAEKVEQLVLWMGAGLGRAYRHFAKRRRTAAPDYAAARTVRRDGRKVGRNDPCPCGSGKKFKRCCGAEGNPASH